MLFQSEPQGAGQDVPGSTEAETATAAAGPPPAPQPLAVQTLTGLLAAQQSSPTSSTLANRMIGALDTDGDGALSLAEITSALGSSTQLPPDQLAQAVSQLDANGDGKLSADELTSGLRTARAHGGHHHHHHHASGASDSDLASQIISGADSSGDGVLSPDEVAQALGLGNTASSADPTASDPFSQLFAQLDTNGDGSLSASELTTAIDAFRAAHHHAEPGQPAPTAQAGVNA